MDKSKFVRELRELIRQLMRSSSFHDRFEASCCGITLAQCHTIIEIASAREISLNELAERLGVDNSTMSRTINNLLDRGLAVRNTDPRDRRYVKIKLTDKGFEMYRSIRTNMNMYYMSLLKDIPEEKHGQIIESLSLLLEAMKNESISRDL